MRFRSIWLLVLLLGPGWSSATAAVQLAGLFADHMVLQRDMPVPVWGTAAPRENITITFAGQAVRATADSDGRWRVMLAPLAASMESRPLSVRGEGTAPIVVHDVLVGEVWICGGQSNMERQLGPRPPQQPIINWEAEVAAANHPLIRQYHVPQRPSSRPLHDIEGAWTVCSPATVADFSAVGYFFARDLHRAIGVPVGIIHTSRGGTPAEAWMSAGALAAFPEFAEPLAALARYDRDAEGEQRTYADRLARWLRTHDAGSGDQPWSEPAVGTSAWETLHLPKAWEEQGHAAFDGIAWMRRSFDLPATWSGHDLELRLGAIDDSDTTWVNGVLVGATSGWQESRVYRVPASILKATGNVVAVRVIDTGGNGGIWNPAQPLEVAPLGLAAESLSLRGAWRANFSCEFSRTVRLPSAPGASPYSPSTLWNGMVAGLVPYAIRGVTFYQGESNAERAAQYRTLFPALIADWRRQWGGRGFPFLFVQIAPYRDQPPEIREAQLIALQNTRNTALVVTIDCGDATDIHPPHKQPVGARLALAARALAYGEAIEHSGPVFERATFAQGQATLQFTHLGGGLVAREGALTGFTIAGRDGEFHTARVEIAGETIVVSSSAVPDPAAVRYGWANVASGNLFNRAGLPASPFRTDHP